MTDDEAMCDFEKHGKAAGFLMGCGRMEAVKKGQKRRNSATTIYLDHPHLQNKMYSIARGFTWNLTARLEQLRALQELDSQRGIRAC